MSITAVASFYGISAATAPHSTSGSTANSQRTATAATNASTTVNISDEARQAAAADTGIAIPESIRQAELAERNKVYPQDILDEAQARLQANQGISGNSRNSSTPGLGNLPLLPENEALLAQIKDQMHAAQAANTEGMVNLTPYVRLMQAVQNEGWKTPMTMEDAQREVDISLAMAKLTPASNAAPLSEAEQRQFYTSATAQFEHEMAGEIPDSMKQRWQDEKLSMPETANIKFPQSIWLGLAEAAGIGENEFLAKARQLAGNFSGNSFLQEIEKYVSQRYVAISGTTASQA